MSSSAITRREIIEDEALKWGPEYAKFVSEAVSKNMEFVQSILLMSEANEKLRKSGSYKELTDNVKKYNVEAEKGLVVWKEQDALEKQLISTKRKMQLATESTNRSLVTSKIQLAEVNKLVRDQQRESAGLIGAYERLNRARNEAQKRLAELLSAEKANRQEIAQATLEYDKLDARVKAVDASIRNYSKNIGNYSSAFGGLNGTMRDLLSTFGLVTGMALFGTIIKDIFSVVRDFDRQLIAVGKTTNITGDDLKGFGKEVVEVGQKLEGISVEGLLKSSEVAGQLGVKGTANILKFSEAIEKLKLTSDIGTDEQVQDFAKFIEVSADSFENADKLASVITQLGNNFATTEAQVLSNATEIQKGIAVYKTSAQGVLGLGAATSSLGSEAEASRSAIQSTFGVINGAIATGKNLEKVLKLTNLTQKELSKQFNSDATGVFVKFVGGLKEAEERGENLALVLEDVEITEKRAFTVIGALAANYDVLNNAVSAANQEYIDNAALNKEVEAASQSLSSIIGDIKDEWQGYVLNQNQASEGGEKLARVLRFVRDNLSSIITNVIKYGSVLLAAVGIYKGVNYVIAVYNALMIAARAAQIQFTISTGLGTVAMKAQAKAAQEAAAAQGLLNAATKATPWGLILAAIAAVVTAYIMFNDELDRSQALAKSIARQNKERSESEKKYADDRAKNQERDFKAIDDEMALRKAKGENEDKLDKESVARKIEVVKTQLQVYNDLKRSEVDRTNAEIRETAARIKAMDAEKEAALRLVTAKYRRQGNTLPQGEADFQDRRFDTTGEKERLARLKAELKNNSDLTIGEQKRLQAIISDLSKQQAKQNAEGRKEEDEKAKKAREKARKEYLANLKDQENDDFALRQFRLKNAISLNDDIIKDDKLSADERIEALYEKQQLETSIENDTLQHKLLNISRYDDAIRDLTNEEIKTLIAGGEIKRKLRDDEKLAIEQHRANLLAVNKKFKDEEERLLEFDVNKFKAQLDLELKQRDTQLQQKLTKENEYYKVLLDGAENNLAQIELLTEEHEKRVSKIKKNAALDVLKFQIESIDKLLQTENLSKEKRIEFENQLATFRREVSDMDVQVNSEKNEKKLLNEEEFSESMKDLGTQLHSALMDLVNNIFEARISNIDAEIEKSESYYDRQIELAGNDQRKKDALQKESDKKTEALEKKKRQEQRKQAIFNKAIKAGEITAATALAVMQGFAQLGPIGGAIATALVLALGAVQLAAVLSAPIPNAYKMGRDDGPAETAYVGDGGRPEVVTRPDGSDPWVTPSRPTLVKLRAHDKVWPSVESYNEAMRASLRQTVAADTRQSTQAASYLFNFDNSDLLEEMKRNTRAIEKNRTVIMPGHRMPDLNYQFHKLSKLNWSA